jgi:hypothetical protein
LERRKIEHEAFSGRVLGLVATNALELGVDIGVLDAVILCGFPVSLASFVGSSTAFFHVHSHSLSANKLEEQEGGPVIHWLSMLPTIAESIATTVFFLTTSSTSLCRTLSSI